MEFKPESNTPGPQQVQNNFDANSEVSQQLGLLRTKGSTVSYGNLLTLPLTNVGGAANTDGGLLYVEPVYVQRSTGSASYPLLQKVLVAYGENIGFQDTLDAALVEAFTGTNSPTTGDNGGSSGGGGDGQTGSSDNSALTKALDDATQALADSQTALAKGDFTAYGEAQERLRDAIERAVAAQPSASTPAPSGSASPSKTATPAGSSTAAPSG